MIDFGLVALVIVLLFLIALNMHAWRAVLLERDRIITAAIEMKLAVDTATARAQTALDIAENAKQTAESVKTANYTKVMEKVLEVEATLSKYDSVVSNLTAKIVSTNNRLSGAMRAGREFGQDKENSQVEYPLENQIQMEMPAQATGIPKSFGRKMA